MSRCKFCEQNGVITEGEWQKTQFGNRLFVNGEQHKCPYYVKKPVAPAPGVIQSRENSGTYVPSGYVQEPKLATMTNDTAMQGFETIKKMGEDVKALNIRVADIQQYQVGIEGLLAKVNQKLDLIMEATGVSDTLGPKPVDMPPRKPALGDIENP